MGDLSTEAIMRIVAAAVPDLARRSVDVPTVRIGTVDQTSDPSSTHVAVLMDGMDDQATSVLNGTGSVLFAGQRVSVLFYPPHGALVVGVLPPLLILEQTWHTTYDVTSSGSVSTSPSSWTLLTADGTGWADSGGVLVCEVEGQWEGTVQAGWASNGTGTHRAAGLTLNGAGFAARSSHQFAGGGGTPTSGYGLWGAGGPVPFDAAIDDQLGLVARHDASVALAVDVYVKLRLLGPSA